MKNTNNTGFSLVELLVAMTLGLVITGGVIQVVTVSNGTYNDLIIQSRMQETAKIALDYITRDLRNVGYVGCNPREVIVSNTIPTASAKYFTLQGVVNGYDKSFATGDAGYDALLTNSDLLELYIPDIDNGFAISNHDAGSRKFELPAATNTRDAGTVWMVVDAACSNVGLFIQDNTFPSTTPATVQMDSISHGGTSNCSNDLRGDFDCSSGTGTALAYSVGSMIYPMKRVAFGVQPSGNDATINALFAATSWVSGDTEELLLGVKDLQVIYGLDTNTDNAVDRYATATQITAAGYNMGQVIAVRVSITVEATGGSGFTDQTFTTTVRLRNRGV